jgi:hypothetical protein
MATGNARLKPHEKPAYPHGLKPGGLRRVPQVTQDSLALDAHNSDYRQTGCKATE